MKKLMAMIALVAMVAISSVAYAQSGAVTVTGSVGDILTVAPCGATFASGIAVGSVSDAQCTSLYSSNAATGYTLTFAATNATLDHQTQAHTIDALGASADCATQAAECFSYEWDTTDAVGGGTDNITTEDPIPTGAGVAVYTGGGAGDVADAETSTFDFHAWAENTTESGVYELTGGLLTVAAQ